MSVAEKSIKTGGGSAIPQDDDLSLQIRMFSGAADKIESEKTSVAAQQQVLLPSDGNLRTPPDYGM